MIKGNGILKKYYCIRCKKLIKEAEFKPVKWNKKKREYRFNIHLYPSVFDGKCPYCGNKFYHV